MNVGASRCGTMWASSPTGECNLFEVWANTVRPYGGFEVWADNIRPYDFNTLPKLCFYHIKEGRIMQPFLPFLC